jgi:cellulose synthase/poly-beta-1,6-N-acetylglucosamine synthase-like glycosyltransferase
MAWPVALFCLSVGFALYVLFGYPLLLSVRASLREKPIARSSLHEPTVSILLAVRNGDRWARQKLRNLLALEYPRAKVQILVADDGSDDQTAACVKEFAGEGLELVSLSPGGKAAALNALLPRATGEIVFFTDVRQELEPQSLRRLVACFADPQVGAASGELLIRRGATSLEESVGMYWRYEKWIRKNLSRVDSLMGATGCIYAMRRSLISPMPPDTLLDDVYLPLQAFFAGYRVVMEEGARAYDAPTQLNAEFRRKVRTLAGVYQVMGLCPKLLTPSNRMLLDFVSHKAARLLLPFALMLAAAASCALPAGWRAAALTAQAGFYGLALADEWLPESSRLRKVSSPARTFVVLMTASVYAISILFVPARRLWTAGR